MCGIVGIASIRSPQDIDRDILDSMLLMLKHRGPDEMGTYRDSRVGLGNARLSIIDLSTGQQPIPNEDDSVWIVYNGEIFNYRELMADLQARGHRFRTRSDTEVIVHLYEEYGPACVDHMNGQFAFAIWDRPRNRLMLARDRVGIRPLFYMVLGDLLLFASEIKAIAAHPAVRLTIDPLALHQTLTFWSPIGEATSFVGVRSLRPGHILLLQDGTITTYRFWDYPYLPADQIPDRPLEDLLEELEALYRDSVKRRLIADVPVGAYLSGGIDSSLTAAVIRQDVRQELQTFSITFADPLFDESNFQLQMAAHLDTQHRTVHATNRDIAEAFPRTVFHTETPLTRTAATPMLLLSGLVRASGFKVVLTGEGADELFAGYNIFKEALARRFWAKNPDSAFRPLLLRRLYPYIPALQDHRGLAAFFGKGLTETDDPLYSHCVRWSGGRRLRMLLHDEIQSATSADALLESVRQMLPPDFSRWPLLSQAQYLESTIFLSHYLLSSQGDRPAMANSVEGRFPFLDYRIAEFAARMPPRHKLRGFKEKFILKKMAQPLLPPEIIWRPKQPYRAPIILSFLGPDAPPYVAELLTPHALDEIGLWNAKAVERLVEMCRRNPDNEADAMALVAIISSQLLYRQFCSGRLLPDRTGAPPIRRSGVDALQPAHRKDRPA